MARLDIPSKKNELGESLAEENARLRREYMLLRRGWETATTLQADIATRALRQAIGARNSFKGLVHHTDCGGQYTDREYRKTMKRAGMIQNMSNPGNCLDNAMAESFFATRKSELECRVFP